MKIRTFAGLALALAASMGIGCASTDAGVDQSELARLVGTDHSVRLDAQLLGNLKSGSNIGIRFEVENLRDEPIVFADIKPESSYDPETGVVTVLLGSEVPGNEFVPRMEIVRSGEKKTFDVGVNIGRASTARGRSARLVRVRLAWLQDATPFAELVAMEQKAWRNPSLADALFIPWVENLKFVTTNEVPIDWNRAGVPVPTRRPRGF